MGGQGKIMMESCARKLWVVPVMGTILALGGCAALQKGKAPQEAVEVPSPVKYTEASAGLPTVRIWKSQIAFGDVNGDGFPDLGMVSRLADGPWVYVGDGKGNWTPFSEGLPREPFCGGGMDFADMNNDGHMDLALADHCKGVYAFLGDGKGNWKSASSGLPTIGAEDVTVGDFNNDGCPDMATVAMGEEGVRAFLGNCKGVWKESSEGLAQTDWGNSIVSGDINGDGNQDIVAAYARGPRAWLGDGKGGWTEASVGLPAPEIYGLYWGIAIGDLNNDGRLDIVSGSQMPPQPEGCGKPGNPACVAGGVEVFLQQPDGTWKESTEGILPMNALGVAVGDLNNDGNNDIVAAGKRALNEIGGVYGVFPFLGDGTGKWTPVKESGLPTTGKERTWGVGISDIDKDGVLDIGVAFGDVVAPTWRSGAQIVPDASKPNAPQRGKFGSIAVWRGQMVK